MHIGGDTRGESAVEERCASLPFGLQATGHGRGGPREGATAIEDRPIVRFLRHTHDRLAAPGHWHPRVQVLLRVRKR